MKSKVIALAILFLPVIYVLSCNRTEKKINQSSFKFPKSLASLGFFQGELSDLIPDHDVIPYQLSSTLFSDYAEKQRLIKLPKGKKILIKGDGLPTFPEGTLIAKTFFYEPSLKEKRRQIIETRVLFLQKGKWFAGAYKWNKAQNQANYTAQSSIVPIEITNVKGRIQHINYRIPSAEDCQSCHRSLNDILPIGPKAMNMNRNIIVKKKTVNQLEFFKTLGIINSDAGIYKIATLPSYEDRNATLEHRARAYLEINCAHCHNPDGLAYRQSIMFSYQVPLQQSGIELNKENIIDRMESLGMFHMPKLGTTVIDTKGVELIKNYIKNLPR